MRRPNGGDAGTSVLGDYDVANGILDAHRQRPDRPRHCRHKGRRACRQSRPTSSALKTASTPTSSPSGTARASPARLRAPPTSAAGFDLIGLGVIRNSDLDVITGLPGSTYTTFSGQPVTPDDVLVKYTYIGDGNLDGLVSFDDYVGMDNAFFGLIPNLGWATGDINFDGVINFDDYTVVDQAFFFQGGATAAACPPSPNRVRGLWCSLRALRLLVFGGISNVRLRIRRNDAPQGRGSVIVGMRRHLLRRASRHNIPARSPLRGPGR